MFYFCVFDKKTHTLCTKWLYFAFEFTTYTLLPFSFTWKSRSSLVLDLEGKVDQVRMCILRDITVD